MKIKKRVTIHLYEDDIKNLITDHLTSEGYNVSADDVSLKVSMQWKGYGTNEYQSPYFEECIVEVKEK